MNFQELAQKIRRIDEGSVVECGDMMGGHMPMQQPMPQQDSVSMNVSMNATGRGGIRDLMQVLQNIENNVTGGHSDPIIDIGPSDMELDAEPIGVDSMMGGEVEMEPEDEIEFGQEEPFDDETPFDDEGPAAELDAQDQGGKGINPKIKHAIAPVVQAVGLAHALGKDPAKVFGDKVTDETDGMPVEPMQLDTEADVDSEVIASEEFANRPNTKYQSANYMTKTLAQDQRMTKGGYRNSDNPLAMKEGLVSELANLYQEVKLRESR